MGGKWAGLKQHGCYTIGSFSLTPVRHHYRVCCAARCALVLNRRTGLLFCCLVPLTLSYKFSMAKRRAEEPLLLDSPSKRRHLAPLCCVGMQLESMASAGGVSSPSILTLLGSRCRKRPHYSDNEASDLFPKVSLWDSGKFALDVSQEPPSGSFQDERGPCTLSRNKRPREDSFGSDTVRPAGNDKVGNMD